MIEKTERGSTREETYMVLRDDVAEEIEMGRGNTNTESSPRTEPAGAEVQNSRYCTFMLQLTLFSSIPMVSYGLTCFSPIVPVLEEMYNKSHYDRYGVAMPLRKWELLKTLSLSLNVAGAFVGCFVLLGVMRCATRKRSMLVLHYINLVGAAIISAAGGLTKAYEPVIIGRFLMGIASGMSLSIAPVVISETCVKHRRPVYDGLIGVSLALGALLGVFFGWPKIFGTPQLWPIITLIPAAPSLVYIILSIPETPYQVLKSGRRSEMIKLMRRLRNGPMSAISNEINSMLDENTSSSALLDSDSDESSIINTQNQHDITFREAFGIRQYRRQFIMVLLLFANFMLNGFCNVISYSDEIFMQAGINVNSATATSVYVFLFQVVAAIPGSLLFHRIGSWMLCILGNVVMIMGHILIVVGLTVAQNSPQPQTSWIAVIGVAVYLLGFAGGENIGIFPLIAELTTERSRPICLSFGSATIWFTGWIVGFAASYLETWGPSGLLAWMGFTTVFTIYIVFLVPNTKKKTSEQIQGQFKSV